MENKRNLIYKKFRDETFTIRGLNVWCTVLIKDMNKGEWSCEDKEKIKYTLLLIVGH